MPMIGGNSLTIDEIIDKGIEVGASDVHLSPSKPIWFRVDGRMTTIPDTPVITTGDTEAMLEQVMCFEQIRKRYDERKSYDISITTENRNSRSRLHFYETDKGVCVSARIIPLEAKGLDDLLVPSVVKRWANERGIVFVSGLANMGKTTTLASLVEYINNSRTDKIVKLEDPIEYVHADKKSCIFQREVGTNSPTPEDALLDILREDTDTVFVGEVRTAAAMDAVFGMAENGLRVFTTLHATGALETIEKIVNLFPGREHERVYKRLQWTLTGILNQWLVPKKGGGRVLACEILEGSDAVRQLIGQMKIAQIGHYMESGHDGMITLKKYKDQLSGKGLL